MSIGAFSGTLGGGKSLDAILDAFQYSLAAGGAPIASNLELFPAPFAQHFALNPRFKLVRIQKPEHFLRFMVEGGGILVWDEMHQDSDARQSTNVRNILLSQWLMFLRKWGITTFYTTQDVSQIDRRMRNVTDYLTFCEAIGPRANRRYRFTTTHYRTGRVLRRIELTADQVKHIYAAYDTYEPPRRMPFPEKIQEHDDFLVWCGKAAKFAREYEGPPDRAWETFVSQTGYTESKAAKGRKKVSPESHVRKGSRRSAGGRGGSDSSDTDSLEAEA